MRTTAAASPQAATIARENPHATSPCWNISGGYLNKKRKTFSTTPPFYLTRAANDTPRTFFITVADRDSDRRENGPIPSVPPALRSQSSPGVCDTPAPPP